MREARGAQAVPRYGQIDLMSAYRFAGHLFVLDVAHPGFRFRVRFSGTEIARMFGWEATGRYLDDLDLGPHGHEILGSYKHVATTAEPLFTFSAMVAKEDVVPELSEKKVIAMKRMAYPVLGQGDRVDHIVGALVRVETEFPPIPFQVEPVIDGPPWRAGGASRPAAPDDMVLTDRIVAVTPH